MGIQLKLYQDSTLKLIFLDKQRCLIFLYIKVKTHFMLVKDNVCSITVTGQKQALIGRSVRKYVSII